ncbi:DJ-1/PfpI family protein [Paenibacillus sp. GCM10023252]|uniref:DJ-1/PfpI family protein n=1 Tax=Paenibacillus sp. GCM10023252 TaxID=3252649 RepID=UPI003612955E
MSNIKESRAFLVGLYLFDDVEVLDFAGPFEVLSVTLDGGGHKPFDVRIVSEHGGVVNARHGLKVQADYSFADAPDFDILIVPGGLGARQEMYREPVLSWVREQAGKVELLTSVCTGALILANAGLLDGKRATTHWASLDRMETEFPQVQVQRGVKFVDEGSTVSSAGIAAGIHMAFHLVTRLIGVEAARQTAKVMEYDIEL